MSVIYFLLGLVVGYFFAGFLMGCWRANRKMMFKVKGFHFHHSLIGLGLILVFLFTKDVFWLGGGIGIIVHHTQVERKFVFADKS